MTKVTLIDIFGFPQKIVERYYLKICSERDRESFLDVTEVWNNKVFPFIIEHAVLGDLEQIRKVG